MKAMTVAMYVGAACLCAAGCSTEPKTETDRKALNYDTSGALESFKGADSSLNDLLGRSAGYAVFPDVGKAGFIAGGAYGRGEVFCLRDGQPFPELVGCLTYERGKQGLAVLEQGRVS